MDVCIPDHTSAHQDKSCNSWSLSPSRYESEDLSVNHLRTSSTKLRNMENPKQSTSDINLSTRKKDTSDVLKEVERKDLDKIKSRNSTSDKCFTNCVSSPPLGDRKSYADGLLGGGRKQTDGEASEVSKANIRANSTSLCYSQSNSPPTPLKLVSAMKGTREKQGVPPKKLSVTWAPDVYDPIPTSVSHFPSYKNKSYRNGGNKYKDRKQKNGGKSPRGKKGKDKKKKQACNNNDSTSKPESSDKESSSLSRLKSQVDAANVNVESLDPFCGTSFFKKSVTEMHCPVAEAT